MKLSVNSKSVQERDIIARIRNEWKIHWELNFCQLSALVIYRRLIKIIRETNIEFLQGDKKRSAE